MNCAAPRAIFCERAKRAKYGPIVFGPLRVSSWVRKGAESMCTLDG